MKQRNDLKPRVLLNLHTLKSTPDEEIYKELMRAVQALSIKRFGQVIEPLLRNQRVQNALPCFDNSLEAMSVAKNFQITSIERLLEFYKIVLITQSGKINEFINVRDRFESLLVANKLDLCEQLLADFRNSHGESIWWIKAKLILLFYKQDTEEMQVFCDEVKLRSGKGIFTYYINSLILSTQASSPASNLEKIVLKAIEEFDKAGISHVSWFLDTLFFPQILSVRDVELDNLSALTQLPLVDMYSILTSSLFSFINCSDEAPDKRKLCISFLKNLSQGVQDFQVINSLAYFQGEPGGLTGVERDLVASYESGQYAKVLTTFGASLDLIQHPISFLNIVAKSSIRKKTTVVTGLPIIDDTLRNLVDINSLSSRASQARQEIIERVVRLNGSRVALELQALLAVAIPQFFEERKLKRVLEAATCRQGSALPIVKSIISSGKRIFDEGYSFIDPQNVADERVIRCRGEWKFAHPEHQELTSATSLVKDFIEFKSRALVSSNSLDELVGLAASYLANYPESYVCFPMDKLVEHIEENFVHDIDSIVVCHYFVKFVSSDKRTLLNEIFEEYLISCGESKPSEIFDQLHGCSIRTNKLFFGDICSFENLDFLDAFQSSDELRAERIKLIDYLYSCKLMSKESYSNELDEIVNLIVMDSATSNFSRSKVYVDESSLKRKVIEEVTTLFELYQFSSSSDENEEDGLFVINEADSENEKFAAGVLSGQQSSLLVKIIDVIHQSFLYDETFGLDSNLSSEIRHGIFSNFMLSEVDAKHLIAEKTDAGTYKSVEYWHEFYSGLLVPRFLKDLDEEFADFSEKFNMLVDDSERWMKIGFNDKDSAFSFVISLDDFKVVKSKAASCMAVEDLIDEVLKVLWSKTEAGLAILKDRINSGLKHNVEALFDDLTVRMVEVKGNAALGEVMSNIESARNNTREIIAEISEWFARSKSKIFDDQSLIQLIGIAVSCFEKIKGRAINITRSFSGEVASHEVSGAFVNPMILAMINLLTNCIRHSGLDLNVDIEIAVEVREKGFVISVYNSLSSQRLSEMDSSFITLLNENFTSSESLELMRKEGGTGLAKAFHHLKSADLGFDLAVSLNEARFCSEVTYVDVRIAG
ncbi:hypothetical protein GHO35_24755 [Pseudomonas helleri]|uniref:hypothetical protein n=1 Tax=Pseudomonas helleri TaxID=1608996 RepID=UPI0012950943|nr:hypothetical protein [Pseudomonas helleri]MQU24324.1 hypothetical protein [Pseudomonas helleri]